MTSGGKTHLGLGAVVATALAVGYLAAATVLPAALPLLTIAAVPATCAVASVAGRRRAHAIALAAIGGWLAVGVFVAWHLRDAPTAGLLWAVTFLFVLPLPLIPWIYSRTSSPFPGQRSPAPGPPAP